MGILNSKEKTFQLFIEDIACFYKDQRVLLTHIRHLPREKNIDICGYMFDYYLLDHGSVVRVEQEQEIDFELSICEISGYRITSGQDLNDLHQFLSIKYKSIDKCEYFL